MDNTWETKDAEPPPKFDSEMRAAFSELRPIHRRMLDGEMTEHQYIVIRERVIERHLDKEEVA